VMRRVPDPIDTTNGRVQRGRANDSPLQIKSTRGLRCNPWFVGILWQAIDMPAGTDADESVPSISESFHVLVFAFSLRFVCIVNDQY